MAPLRLVGALFCSAAVISDGRRVVISKERVLNSADVTQRLALLKEECQDYPDGVGFGLGDTVRIFSEADSKHNRAGVVGCNVEDQKVCLQGGKGCYDANQLRHISTIEFTLSTVRSTASQIAAAVAGDVKEQWADVRLRLMDLSVFVSDQVTQIADTLSTAADVCDEQSRAKTKAKFAAASASIKSRLAMVASSAAEYAGDVKASAEAMAATAVAKLVKLQQTLLEEAGSYYEANLKEVVVALEKYLSNIAAAATNVPDELVPDGLERAIADFSVKAAELSGKLAELSEDVYFKVKGQIGILQAATGRLVAALAERWSDLKAAVRKQADAALAQLSTYTASALEAACNFDVKEQAQAAFDKIRSRFQQVVETAKSVGQQIKETLAETADNLAAAIAAIAADLKASLIKVYNSEGVQSKLALLQSEVAELKKLANEQSTLVQKFVGNILKYFSRFMPSWAVEKLSAAQSRAKELAAKIRSQIEELTSDVTDGETTVVDVDDDADTPQLA